VIDALETGSTQLIRNTAAQQLADVQKQHPDELFNLLGYYESTEYCPSRVVCIVIGQWSGFHVIPYIGVHILT
jgi:hypothetical protein